MSAVSHETKCQRSSGTADKTPPRPGGDGAGAAEIVWQKARGADTMRTRCRMGATATRARADRVQVEAVADRDTHTGQRSDTSIASPATTSPLTAAACITREWVPSLEARRIPSAAAPNTG